MKPKHIGLFGNFGSDNLGNEASLAAMLGFLRRARPEAQITCICYGIEKARQEHRVNAIPIALPPPANKWLKLLNRLLLNLPFRFRDIAHTLHAVRRFDVLVVPGTGILDDFSERWTRIPYHLFKWSVAAKLNRRPFAFVSIGAGPIFHPFSRWLMKWAARMACYRSYRDEASKEYMKALGVHSERDQVFPDLVFALPVPECVPMQMQHERSPIIGVGVMNYFGWDRTASNRDQIHETYMSRMTQFVFWLLEHGFRVRLLIGALSDQRCFDDVIRRVIGKLGEPAAKEIIAEPAYSMDELMRQMVGTELVVATRFHVIVSAMKVGRPVISIGYAGKNDSLLAQIGLEAYCQSAEQLNVAHLIMQFEKLFQARMQFTDRIAETTRRYQECLGQQNAYLLANVL